MPVGSVTIRTIVALGVPNAAVTAITVVMELTLKLASRRGLEAPSHTSVVGVPGLAVWIVTVSETVFELEAVK
jgi:predicted secreted protein